MECSCTISKRYKERFLDELRDIKNPFNDIHDTNVRCVNEAHFNKLKQVLRNLYRILEEWKVEIP